MLVKPVNFPYWHQSSLVQQRLQPYDFELKSTDALFILWSEALLTLSQLGRHSGIKQVEGSYLCTGSILWDLLSARKPPHLNQAGAVSTASPALFTHLSHLEFWQKSASFIASAAPEELNQTWASIKQRALLSRCRCRQGHLYVISHSYKRGQNILVSWYRWLPVFPEMGHASVGIIHRGQSVLFWYLLTNSTKTLWRNN